MPTARIAVVDYNDHRAGGASRAAFVDALGKSIEAFGFVNVVGHGMTPERLESAYAAARELFALPTEIKQKYEDPASGRQRGYTPFGLEKAKDRPTPDLKEFWQIGPDAAHLPANKLPTETPGATNNLLDFYARQHAFATDLLSAIGEYLGYAPDFVRNMVSGGNSVLRVIHYPDVPEAEPGAVRAAQHEDINLLTVLPASTRPGLELMTRDGEWMAIEAPPGVMVCDTGDMMKRLTGGKLPATTHRVVNPEGDDGGRLSMPFFLHPNPSFVITSPDGSEPPITAAEFLHRRLVENGVADG